MSSLFQEKISEKGARILEPRIDIYFDDMGAVLGDTMRIAGVLGVSSENVLYNRELLAMYMICDPQDTAPRLLFPFFVLIAGIASLSLIIVIHHSFAVSMNARIHQFGIFSSIEATPKQIRSCLLQEAAALCILPIFFGNLLGILISMGMIHMVNGLLGSGVPGRENVTLGELDALQEQVDCLLGENYKVESENRIQEAETNDKQVQGMMTIFGGFCVLIAMIGIGNVFSNTLGFVRQRKREFARYMSVGMTQGEIKKMFCVEALAIANDVDISCSLTFFHFIVSFYCPLC